MLCTHCVQKSDIYSEVKELDGASLIVALVVQEVPDRCTALV